jgi:hypothetical protein
MRLFKKTEEYKEPYRHERFFILLSFSAAALAGYLLTNYIGLLGA